MNYKKVKIFQTLLYRLLRIPNKTFNFHTNIHTKVESNRLLSLRLKDDQPLMVGKLGESELHVLRNYLAIQRAKNRGCLFKIYDFIKHREEHLWTGLITITKDSGFFPKDETLLNKFSEIYIEAIKQLDIFGTMHGESGWYNNRGEDFILNKFNKNVKIISAISLEPYCSMDNPYTLSLKNQKILVIHPFTESIQNNYKNRSKLFPATILPDFKLITYKPVQSIAYNKTEYKDWFEALEKMKSDINEIDFDIAFLGCGAYGLPLAAHIKSLGKKSIHIGGALQLFFGIKGNRWRNHPYISTLFNKNWTDPLQSETPNNAEMIGLGAKDYW